ncbi:MAG: hypothetical protein AAF318_16535 [Pseudomonadota bacterium]
MGPLKRLVCAFVVAATPAGAADLLLPPVEGTIEAHLCVIQALTGVVEVYEEPLGEVSGYLPTGMVVEIMEPEWSDRTDLYVRIKPPRAHNYYGWVETASFVCA